MFNRKELNLLILLAFIQFCHIIDFMIMMPLGPQLTKAFDITIRKFNFLVSAYTFAAGISSFLGIFYLDLFDRRKMMLLTLAGFSSGTLLCGYAQSYEQLLLARALAGAFGGLSGALVLSIVGDEIALAKRASAMGIVMMSFSAAAALGVPLGLLISEYYDWHTPFQFLGIMSFVILLSFFIITEPMTKHLLKAEKFSLQNLFQIFSSVAKNSNQQWALTLTFTLMLGQFTVIPNLSNYVVFNLKVESHDLIYIYLCGGLATAITSPLIGRLADQKGRRLIFSIFSLLMIIPLYLVTNVVVYNLFLILIFSTIFFIVSSGRFVPAITMVTSTVRPQDRGKFMSINSTLQQLGSGLAAIIGGMITYENIDKSLVNYNYVGWFAIAMTITAFFIGRRLKELN